LLVLAPPPVEHGEQAFRKRGGHVLAQTERRRSLALAQQADALAHAAPKLMDVENAGRVALWHAARGAGSARKINDQRCDAIAGGCGGTPDRDLARPALEPQRNEVDLAWGEFSGVGEINQQNLRVGFHAGRLSAFVVRMGDIVSGHAPILDERIDAVQQLPFALADVLIDMIIGDHLLPGAPQDALAYQGRARAGCASRNSFQTMLISV
jgi:hypothetical protein